jgi:hypothetical protein
LPACETGIRRRSNGASGALKQDTWREWTISITRARRRACAHEEMRGMRDDADPAARDLQLPSPSLS